MQLQRYLQTSFKCRSGMRKVYLKKRDLPFAREKLGEWGTENITILDIDSSNWKRLFTGTVQANKNFFARTIPANKNLVGSLNMKQNAIGRPLPRFLPKN